MKHLISIILFLSFLMIHPAISQQSEFLDSLMNELRTNSTQDTNRVHLLTDIAAEFDEPANYDKIRRYGEEALELSEILDFQVGIGLANNAMMTHYVYKRDFEKVIKHGLDALTAFDKSGGHPQANTTYNNLGIAYKNLNELDKAIDMYLKIVEHLENKPLSTPHMSTYYNLANTYLQNYEPEKAIIWGEKLLEVSEELKSEKGISMAYITLTRLYAPRNLNPQKSLEYGEKALAMIDSTSQLDRYNYARSLIAGAHFSAKNYKEAEELFLDLIEYNTSIESYGANSQAYKTLFRMYLEMGEDDKSFEATKLANENLIKSEEKKNQGIIKELEVKYETDKILREKTLAEEKAILNRNLLIASIVSIFLLLIAGYFYNKQQQLKKKAEIVGLELKETKSKLLLERKLRDSELKALKAQMNPHFLFNAFNSIQEYIILNKRELASDYLGKFADLMRIYLDHSRENSILLEDEIRAADLYLQLEKIRFEDDMDYSIAVADDLDQEMTGIPPMLIQPFIENALKHGLFHKKGEKRIDIDFSKDAERNLICNIIDNGIGRKQSGLINEKRLTKHKSFATAATQNRIELLNVGREKDISFSIIDLFDENQNAAGTQIVLKIPLS